MWMTKPFAVFKNELNFNMLGSTKPWHSSDTYPHTSFDTVAEDKKNITSKDVKERY